MKLAVGNEEGAQRVVPDIVTRSPIARSPSGRKLLRTPETGGSLLSFVLAVTTPPLPPPANAATSASATATTTISSSSPTTTTASTSQLQRRGARSAAAKAMPADKVAFRDSPTLPVNVPAPPAPPTPTQALPSSPPTPTSDAASPRAHSRHHRHNRRRRRRSKGHGPPPTLLPASQRVPIDLRWRWAGKGVHSQGINLTWRLPRRMDDPPMGSGRFVVQVASGEGWDFDDDSVVSYGRQNFQPPPSSTPLLSAPCHLNTRLLSLALPSLRWRASSFKPAPATASALATRRLAATPTHRRPGREPVHCPTPLDAARSRLRVAHAREPPLHQPFASHLPIAASWQAPPPTCGVPCCNDLHLMLPLGSALAPTRAQVTGQVQAQARAQAQAQQHRHRPQIQRTLHSLALTLSQWPVPRTPPSAARSTQRCRASLPDPGCSTSMQAQPGAATRPMLIATLLLLLLTPATIALTARTLHALR